MGEARTEFGRAVVSMRERHARGGVTTPAEKRLLDALGGLSDPQLDVLGDVAVAALQQLLTVERTVTVEYRCAAHRRPWWRRWFR